MRAGQSRVGGDGFRKQRLGVVKAPLAAANRAEQVERPRFVRRKLQDGSQLLLGFGKTVLADERGGLFKPRVNRTAALRSRAERGEKDERQCEGKPTHAATWTAGWRSGS